MARYDLTKILSINVPRELGTATFDADADFGQIALRVRNGAKFVNVRLISFGSQVEIETWDGKRLIWVTKANHDADAAQLVERDIEMFLA